MNIDKVKLNAVVHCPPDRGEAAYSGKVTHIGTEPSKNIKGVEYVWVTVKRSTGTSHVWPSNRLG